MAAEALRLVLVTSALFCVGGSSSKLPKQAIDSFLRLFISIAVGLASSPEKPSLGCGLRLLAVLSATFCSSLCLGVGVMRHKFLVLLALSLDRPRKIDDNTETVSSCLDEEAGVEILSSHSDEVRGESGVPVSPVHL